jgi:hypothetical protein
MERTSKWASIQKDKLTGKHADRWINLQTADQAGRQIDKQTDKQ